VFFLFPSGGKPNNEITGICKYVGARTHTHTHMTFSFSTSSHNPLLYTTPAVQLLITPSHASPLLSSANTSSSLHATTHNHGYYPVADYSSAAILLPGLCARSPENDKKGQKDKTNGSIHTPRSLPDQRGAVYKV
jgi:hypothetical protein